MILKEIVYGTAEHEEMIELRNKILREPLGLIFSEEDLKKEKNDYLIGCYNKNRLVGCCILSPIDSNTIQLRQMSVSTEVQKKGIGNKILTFAETLSTDKGFRCIYLHARKVAVFFYQKYGYTIIGNEFIEVGIPHCEMIKNLPHDVPRLQRKEGNSLKEK